MAPMKKLSTHVVVSVLVAAVAMSIGSTERTASAHVFDPPPSHLTVGDQEFDATIGGLRTYLDATKTRDPGLFLQLAPDVERLETKRTEAVVAAGVGVVAATVSIVYAFSGQSTCSAPAVTDPAFAAKSDAWAACNQNNTQHAGTFALLGTGALAAGLAAAWAIAPSRADILDVINKNNRLAPEPMRLQLGYDPVSRLAYGGVSLAF